MLYDFITKGGKVIAVGNAWKDLPHHKNIIKVECREDMIDTLLDLAD